MKKEELISEIGRVLEMGLSEENGGNDNVMNHCIKLLDNYTTNITTRLRADFENEKKRNEKIQKIKEEQIKFETLSNFTEILDDFRFFKDVVKDSRSEYVKTGYTLLNKKIKKFLRESNIEIVNTKIPFDSDLHECVSMMDEKKEKGTILRVASRGYKVGNTIIKYPKVIVQS